MKVWYLDHSGVAIETENHLLIFDYYTEEPQGGGLDDGVVTLQKLPADKRLCAFASHGHYDHYNPVLHRWKAERPDTLLFLGDDIPPRPDAVTVRPHETVDIDGIEVFALRSTDQGVAFLVRVDGKNIYHAGDLNWWHWEGEDERWLAQVAQAYKGEIDRLAGQQLDLAFVPVDPRLGSSMLLAAQYFLQVTDTASLVPIHLWDNYTTGAALQADPATGKNASRVLPVLRRGQCFEL